MNEGGSQYSIHSICRICLNHLKNDAAYDLFLIPGLAKKLCVCTSLSVEQQDGFPKNLCSSCYTKLNDLHDFQKLCVDSVQKFQEMVANNAFTCQTFDMLDPNVAGHDTDLGAEDEEHINFDPLLNHKMELIENEEDVFKMLESVDKQAEEVEKEVKKIEEANAKDFADDSSSESSIGFENENDVDFEPNSSDDDLPLAQRLRGKQRSTAKSKPRKTKTNNDNDEDGEDDDSSSESYDDDDDDQSKSKPKRKRIPAAERHLHRLIDCHICHQKFKKAIRYEEHMKYHNDLLPFQCQVETCKKGFTTANGLRLHVDHAHTELAEVHPCTVEGCGKTFPRMRLLTFHMRKAHNISKATAPPRLYNCTECEKVFRCPMALKKHMYKHDGKELPFPCNICGRRFAINSSLKDHLMRHAGIKNYVCPYCGVGKTTRQEWNKHILTHTREKKYKCHVCEHATHNKQALANHVKVVHEKIKNFACQYCGKTFGKSHACKTHELTHTGEKRCECKVCGKKFPYPKNLTKHLKTHEKRVQRALETYRKRQLELGEQAGTDGTGTGGDGGDGSIPQNSTEELLKVCAESVATIPKNPHRVERVDLSQLAGTAVNPIPSVSVPSWSPQVNFVKKEGQHICPGCGRGFNHIGNMKRHYKIIHEKVKDFACRFCPKRFSKAQILRHHEWIHTGEKPFQCQTCGKHFRQETVLKTHMRVHSTDPAVRKRNRNRSETASTKPVTYDEYQEATAEGAVTSAELQAVQIEENEAKRKADEERRKIQEAAYEQLEKLQKQQEIEKASTTYDGYYAQKAQVDGTNVDALKIEHV